MNPSPETMNDAHAGYLTSEQLLFLSPWRPVETDTAWGDGVLWRCLNCSSEVSYFAGLARLEGREGQFMVQCPACDHLHVLRLHEGRGPEIHVEYGGPHVDRFLTFLDRRNQELA
jgi:hypothetical protein